MGVAVRRVFESPAPGRLYVEVASGSVRVDTHAEPTTIVDVEGPRAEEVSVGQDGDQVAVVTPRGRFGMLEQTVHVTVRAPEGVQVVVRCGSATTQVGGAFGRLAAKSGSGDITVDGGTGPVLVESGSGSLRIGHVGAELQAKSGSGPVHVSCLTSPAVVRTGTGSLTVEESTADLHWSSGCGHLRVDEARRGAISFRTATGDVSVGVPPGTPVWTDLASTTGVVTCDVPAVGAPAEGQEHLEVRGRSATGSLALVPSPAAVGA